MNKPQQVKERYSIEGDGNSHRTPTNVADVMTARFKTLVIQAVNETNFGNFETDTVTINVSTHGGKQSIITRNINDILKWQKSELKGDEIPPEYLFHREDRERTPENVVTSITARFRALIIEVINEINFGAFGVDTFTINFSTGDDRRTSVSRNVDHVFRWEGLNLTGSACEETE